MRNSVGATACASCYAWGRGNYQVRLYIGKTNDQTKRNKQRSEPVRYTNSVCVSEGVKSEKSSSMRYGVGVQAICNSLRESGDRRAGRGLLAKMR
eukprot:6188390-Pleurochrysis_carterae.AAC.3